MNFNERLNFVCETTCILVGLKYETDIFNDEIDYEKLTLDFLLPLKQFWSKDLTEENKCDLLIATLSALKFCWGKEAYVELSNHAVALKHEDGRCVQWPL